MDSISEEGDILDIDVVEATCEGDLAAIKEYVAAGGEVDSFDTGETLLHIACYYNQIDIVRYLCRTDIDVDQKDGYGRTALQLALRLGHVECATWLVLEGQAHVGFESALRAAERGALEILKHWAADCGPAGLNARDAAGGKTVLHRACELGREEVVLWLLRQDGIDLGVQDHAGVSGTLCVYRHGMTPALPALLARHHSSAARPGRESNLRRRVARRFAAALAPYLDPHPLLEPPLDGFAGTGEAKEEEPSAGGGAAALGAAATATDGAVAAADDDPLGRVWLLPVAAFLEAGHIQRHQRAREAGALVSAAALPARARVLFVSHRWQLYDLPDLDGRKFHLVRRFLEESEEAFEYLYIDYTCVHQLPVGNAPLLKEDGFPLAGSEAGSLSEADHRRSANEEALFLAQLQAVPLAIMLAADTLVVPKIADEKVKHGVMTYTDLQGYSKRAWCQVELLLSVLSGTQVHIAYWGKKTRTRVFGRNLNLTKLVHKMRTSEYFFCRTDNGVEVFGPSGKRVAQHLRRNGLHLNRKSYFLKKQWHRSRALAAAEPRRLLQRGLRALEALSDEALEALMALRVGPEGAPRMETGGQRGGEELGRLYAGLGKLRFERDRPLLARMLLGALAFFVGRLVPPSPDNGGPREASSPPPTAFSPSNRGETSSKRWSLVDISRRLSLLMNMLQQDSQDPLLFQDPPPSSASKKKGSPQSKKGGDAISKKKGSPRSKKDGDSVSLDTKGVKIKLRKGKSSSRHHEEKGEEKKERDNARSDSSARPGSGGRQQHSHTGGLDAAGSPRGGLLPPRRGGTGREAPAAPARRRSTLHSVGLVSPGGSSTMSEQRPGEGGFWKQLFYQGSTKKAATSKKSS